MQNDLTTALPYSPGPGSLVAGPMCGIKCPIELRHNWLILVQEDLGKQFVYERRSPNDPHFYFKAVIQLPQDAPKSN